MIDTLATVAQLITVGGVITISAATLFYVLTRPAPTWHDDEETLCGQCSDDMGVMFDTWGDIADIDPANRIYCTRCGQ